MSKILTFFVMIMLIHSVCFGGIDFDIADDAVNCGSAASLDDLGAQTISWWMKPDTAGESSLGRIFDKVNYLLFIRTNATTPATTLSLSVSIAGVVTLNRHTVDNWVVLNEWHHYLIIWDGGTSASAYDMYKDGVEATYNATSTDLNTRTSDAAGAFLIGNRASDTARTFDGTISEFAVWNKVLTAAEITLLAKARGKRIPLQIQKASLKMYLPMDDGKGGSSADLDTCKDLSGTGNNGNPDNGANNTGCTWVSETILTYP